MLDALKAWWRQQTVWSLLYLFAIDGPMYVVRVWFRLYLYILAFGSLILWAVLIWWLLRAAWKAVSQ